MPLFIGGPADGQRRAIQTDSNDVPLPSVEFVQGHIPGERTDEPDNPRSLGRKVTLYLRRDLFFSEGAREERLYVYQTQDDDRNVLQALVEGYRNG